MDEFFQSNFVGESISSENFDEIDRPLIEQQTEMIAQIQNEIPNCNNNNNNYHFINNNNSIENNEQIETQKATEVFQSNQIEQIINEEKKSEESTQNKELSNKKLFSDVRYYTINTNNQDIERLLDENGAHKESYLTTFITHVIYDKNGEDPSSNSDYYEANEVFDLTVITSQWVEMCLKCNCLIPTDPYLAKDDNKLFSKIKAININLPEETAKQIFALISFYGGELIDLEMFVNFDNLLDKPTHGFSLVYDTNVENLEKHVKIVTPDWAVDCINKNQLIDELIYNPKYLKSSDSLDDLKNVSEKNSSEENFQNSVSHTQTIEIVNNPTPYSKSITLFTSNSDKVHYFQSHNNNLIQNQEEIKPNMTQNNFLNTTESLPVTENNLPIVENNTPTQKCLYTPGFGINIDVNQNQDSTTPQKQKLLTPKKSSGKKQKSPDSNPKPNYSLNDSMNEIFDSVINKQTGEEKKENENFGLNTNGLVPIHIDLIRPVTASLSLNFDLETDNDQQNNLSESVFKNELSDYKQSNSNLLYNCVFYFKSNEEIYAKECLNDWEKVIVKFGGKVLNNINIDDQVSFSQITHVICPHRFTKCYKKGLESKKKICSIYWLEDVLQEQTYRAPWLVYHFPSPYEPKKGPLQNHIISSHGFNCKEKLFIFQVVWLLNGKYTPYLSNLNSFLICKNLKGIKVEKAKKWDIPIVNANWLMELYLGNTYALTKPIEERYKNISISESYNHFGFETSLVQDFMKLWKNDLPSEALIPFKNVSSNVKYAAKRQTEEDSQNVSTNNKMPRVQLTSLSWQRPQTNVPCVMFTGIEPAKVAQFQRDVIGLGGIIAKQPSQTTLLVVDKIERTAKLLKCLSTCENIVSVKWIIDSKLNGKFLDPSSYQVKDEKFEKHYKCCLKESLERAKTNKPLFHGLVFYLSPSVKPSYQDLVDMIKSAGGTVTNDVPNLQMINEPFRDENKTNLKSKYVIVGSQSDLCILKPFIEKKIPIYSEEIVLSGILIQKLDANLYKFNVL
ncbi:unnamed protein product [Brachionus calyciflorus]|uniref:PAX-interacting protein 1 n=1 Tax=Brachionus calyciflorus TaxID=104777 RepID=A0A813Y7V9_9BILA|nr:unnamed protein product [Brachionus calyciflorus]